MSEIINELLEKLKQCDDFHNRCDFLMEHSEITYMLDYITNLQQENQKLKEVIDRSVEYLETHKRKDEFLELNQWGTRKLLDILKEVE